MIKKNVRGKKSQLISLAPGKKPFERGSEKMCDLASPRLQSSAQRASPYTYLQSAFATHRRWRAYSLAFFRTVLFFSSSWFPFLPPFRDL